MVGELCQFPQYNNDDVHQVEPLLSTWKISVQVGKFKTHKSARRERFRLDFRKHFFKEKGREALHQPAQGSGESSSLKGFKKMYRSGS